MEACRCLIRKNRSQEQAPRPACLSQVLAPSLTRSTAPPTSSGVSQVRPIQRHLQLQGRAPAPPPPPRQGPHHHHSSDAAAAAAAPLWGEEARLIGRYSSGPLVGPRPVTARLAGGAPY